MANENLFQTLIDEVNDSLSGGGQPEAVKAMALLIKAQKPTGCWEHSGNPSCTAIQTIQGIDALLSVGVDDWLRRINSPVRLATSWLCDAQNKSLGKWGQDAFDSAEVLRVLITVNRELQIRGIEDPDLKIHIEQGLEYLRKQCADVSNGFDNYRGLGWYGPAFWASAAVAFFLVEDMPLVRRLLSEIWSFRKEVNGTDTVEDGSAYFECPDQANDGNLRIWNTAHTIIALTRLADLGPPRSELAPFVRWLQYRQNCNLKIKNSYIYGSWGDDAAQVGGDTLPICTYSATVALHRAQGPKAQIDLGVEWFDRVIHEVSGDLLIGNTTLCAAVAMYSEIYDGKKLIPALSLDTILRLIDTSDIYFREIKELHVELEKIQQSKIEEVKRLSDDKNELIATQDKMQKDMDSYAIKIKRDELTIWGVVGLIIGMLGLIISVLSIIASAIFTFFTQK